MNEGICTGSLLRVGASPHGGTGGGLSRKADKVWFHRASKASGSVAELVRSSGLRSGDRRPTAKRPRRRASHGAATAQRNGADEPPPMIPPVCLGAGCECSELLGAERSAAERDGERRSAHLT